MKVQYCADLHLEFPVNEKYLKANPIKPEGEILLLSGLPQFISLNGQLPLKLLKKMGQIRKIDSIVPTYGADYELAWVCEHGNFNPISDS